MPRAIWSVPAYPQALVLCFIAPNILISVGEHVRYAPNRVLFYSSDAAKGTTYSRPQAEAFDPQFIL